MNWNGNKKEGRMIGVTEQAKEELKDILVSKVGDPRACLRIKADDAGLVGLTIDIEMPGDQTVEYQGSILLVAEQELADKLSHVAIDVADTEEGRQLILVEKSD
jgi:Fe-S cluster assembly iron-binding protein IscA